MKIFFKIIFVLYNGIKTIIDRILTIIYKPLFENCGKHITLFPNTTVIKGIENMSLGNYVRIHRYATLFSTDAKLKIGNKVALGPKVTIMTGNHRIDVKGKYIWDVHEKLPENDQDVILEDEIWAGSNVTILAGAHVSRGSVIAAGSLVNKPFPPYSIIGGVPAKLLKFRFTIDEILEHEEKLYPPEKRLSKDELIKARAPYIKKETK